MEVLISVLIGAAAFGGGFFVCHLKDQALIGYLRDHAKVQQQLAHDVNGHRTVISSILEQMIGLEDKVSELSDQVSPVIEQYEQAVSAIEQLQEQTKRRLPSNHPWRMGDLRPVTPFDQQEYSRMASRPPNADEDYQE